MFKLTADEKAHAAELLANTNFKVVLFKRGGFSMKRALLITLGMYVGGLTAYYTYHIIKHELILKGVIQDSDNTLKIWDDVANGRS